MAEVEVGNTLPLRNVPEGTYIYNIESRPGDGGKFVRFRTYATLIAHDSQNNSTASFRSNETLNPDCRCTIGVVAGGGRKEKPLIKAGKTSTNLEASQQFIRKLEGLQ